MKLNTANLLEHLAEFACNLKYEDLSPVVVQEAKRRIFDSLGCLIVGAGRDEAVGMIRENMKGRKWQTSLFNGLAIGMGTYPLDRATYLNTHAIRSLDWNDTYLSKEPAHPSDNIGALLAMAGKTSGRDLILATVLAYEIQCRFCDATSLRKDGWDHTYYLQISSAFGVSKLLGLTKEKMIQAAALSMINVPLRQGRAQSAQLSHQKALYAAEAVRKGTEAALLASYGIKGALEILEGEYGFVRQCVRAYDNKFDVGAFENISSNFKLLTTHLKPYPVEYHAQTAVEMGLEIKKAISDTKKINRIDIYSYEQAKRIIGQGKAARRPETKESADHSLFYVLALTLLAGKMSLEEFNPSWLRDARVWNLIDKMSEVKLKVEYDIAYRKKPIPEFPLYCVVSTNDGQTVGHEVRIPWGHFAKPLSDESLKNKFGDLMNNLDFVWSFERMDKKDLYWALRGIKA